MKTASGAVYVFSSICMRCSYEFTSPREALVFVVSEMDTDDGCAHAFHGKSQCISNSDSDQARVKMIHAIADLHLRLTLVWHREILLCCAQPW